MTATVTTFSMCISPMEKSATFMNQTKVYTTQTCELGLVSLKMFLLTLLAKINLNLQLKIILELLQLGVYKIFKESVRYTTKNYLVEMN